jgi:large subunit ribosomal protein L25
VEIECLPTQIPDRIDVDAGSIEIGGTLHVSDLTAPEGVKITSNPSELILIVSAPKVEEVAPAEVAEEEAAEPELVKAKDEEPKKEEKEQKEEK